MAQQATAETVHNGMSKVERYGWKIISKAGTFEWVDKKDLHFPPEYQREQERQELKIRQIASAFSWPAFGCLCAARRPGDPRLWIFDGMGRLSGALRRSDISKVPVMIFDINSLPEEASAFLGANTLRKPVTAVDKFKPQILSGDKHAALVEKLITSAGRRAANFGGPTTVSCVALLMRLAKQDEKRLERLWPLIVDVCNGQRMAERVVEGLFWIDRKMVGPELLTDARWRRRIMQVGYEDLIHGATKAAAYYAKGGSTIWAKGMVDAINRGLREDNRLRLVEAGA